MRIQQTRHRAALLGAVTTAVLALALTANSGQETGTGTADLGRTTNVAFTGAGHPPAEGTGALAGGGQARAGGRDTDAYAYKHPCDNRKVSVRVTRRAGAAGQRVIAVRNLGDGACGLSHFPRVSLGDSRARDHSKDVRPLVPSGLGGRPAYPVRAGRTAYAVIDLNPGGARTGTVRGIDELNVLADGDHMPNADTRNFPLGTGAKVLKPKLGLYRSTVAEAVRSMRLADAPQR
ncbi:DUF4232 domain-containing protein [Streptomyces sp. NPDC049954]|uniref:DUF4232 domain-containing protein n=1 Tax=Streptomyces sp. NPDC049954 TaxID=3155779 RepID=UPI0034241A52